jgi:hypothetical protein
MAAHVPTAAIPATLPKTYSELYADANNDPWNGNYGPVMRTFRDDNNPLSSTDMFAAAKSMGTDTPNAYIGLFAYKNEECGRSMVLHAISTYPTVLGRTTDWDNKTYSSVQDVDDGDITSIEIGTVSLNEHMRRLLSTCLVPLCELMNCFWLNRLTN